MSNHLIDWDNMSLQEREVFISHATADLIEDLLNVRDAKGMEVIHKNLCSLEQYAEEHLYKVEMLARRDSIVNSLSNIQASIDKFGIDDEAASHLESLAELVRCYVNDVEENNSEEAERDAITNIQSLIDKEFQEAQEAGLI